MTHEQITQAELTPEEAVVIRRVVAERCRPSVESMQNRLAGFVTQRLERMAGDMTNFALAAGSLSAVQPAQQGELRPKEDDVTFVFVSDTAATERGLSWRAEMTLPAQAGIDTPLTVTLTGADGSPLSDGMFRVAGVVLPVASGRAEIPYGLFLSGLKDAHVERITAEGLHVPGTLALF